MGWLENSLGVLLFYENILTMKLIFPKLRCTHLTYIPCSGI